MEALQAEPFIPSGPPCQQLSLRSGMNASLRVFNIYGSQNERYRGFVRVHSPRDCVTAHDAARVGVSVALSLSNQQR
jgi:hypothetical protein